MQTYNNKQLHVFDEYQLLILLFPVTRVFTVFIIPIDRLLKLKFL
jgi:hypothetical protein